jgi:hypothetical protein
MRKQVLMLLSLLGVAAGAARANVGLLVEEPYGRFGGMTPTGHAAVYFSRICAESPSVVRRCREGEAGAVISRYYHMGGYDWLAIPLFPYLFATDRATEVPATAGAAEVEALKQTARARYLEGVAFDGDMSDPKHAAPDWRDTVGVSYLRTIYVFELPTTAEQDDAMIAVLNDHPNKTKFNLLFHNCSDFAQWIIDFYYPHTVHRSLVADMGIMTPKQAACSVTALERKHPDLEVANFVIPQIPGADIRSTPIRDVVESFARSKRYAVPLAPLVVIHPYIGASLMIGWLRAAGFDVRRNAHESESPVELETMVKQQDVAEHVHDVVGGGQ